MANEIKEVLNELKEIRIDIQFIKRHMVDVDIVLTAEEATKLDGTIEEFRQGKTTSLEEFKKEMENV